MRRAATTLLLLILTLSAAGCGLEPRPEPPAPALPAAETAPAPFPAVDEATLWARLNVLVNDTDPESPAFTALKAELARSESDPALSPGLRLMLTRASGFQPLRVSRIWHDQRQAQEEAAELYARSSGPLQSAASALAGAKVVRRLGPALYLVRLSGGDTVFLATSRRLKPGSLLRGIQAVEQTDARQGGAVVEKNLDEGDAPARTYVEVGREQQARFQTERAPALERLRELQAGHAVFERSLRAELARWDAFVREMNDELAPRLLGRAEIPAPAALLRGTKRLGKSWSKQQYYRYALPITGQAQADALLRAHLDERKKEVADLLRSTGVGRGRIRANIDLITYKAYAAGPRLLSLMFEEYRDTGGAHGNYAYASFVLDLKSGQRLALGDLFTDLPAALGVLSELAARRLNLALGGAPFPEGYAPKAENYQAFVLDGSDLVVTFPPYQVASFAEGTQTVRVALHHPRLLPLLSPAFKTARTGY